MTGRTGSASLPWSAATVAYGFALPAVVVGAVSGWFAVWPILDLVLRALGE